MIDDKHLGDEYNIVLTLTWFLDGLVDIAHD